MTWDAKTIAAAAALVTALGGSAVGVIKSFESKDDTEALFRHDRLEIAILNAKVGVLMAKTGVTLDVDIDELKKQLALSSAVDPTRWSLFPEAYAQKLPNPPVPDGFQCECSVSVPVIELPPAAVPNPIQTPVPIQTPAQDQALFQKLLQDQVRKAPRSMDALKAATGN